MIDPLKVTDYERNSDALKEFAIFCICVAGKNSDQTARKVDALVRNPKFLTELSLQYHIPQNTQKGYQFHVANIAGFLRQVKMGQYDRIARAIVELNQLDLHRVTFEQLTNVFGIGPKTAAFFLLHTRRDATVPVVDTHVVKYMATKAITMKVTSDRKKYAMNAQEVAFHLAKDFPNKTLAEADQFVWNVYSGRA